MRKVMGNTILFFPFSILNCFAHEYDWMDISNSLQTEFSLSQNYLNSSGEAIPTGNPSTTIKYTIPNHVLLVDRQGGQAFVKRKSSFAQITTGLNNGKQSESLYNVTLKIYDTLGREVATLVNKQQPPGTYELNFDASKLSSGVFYYQLRSGGFIETKKMLLIK